MTITQLIQSGPRNANELFAKLAATSNGAVKTRESLFNDLKSELELHSRLKEEHLFPVLRKHKETKDRVRVAVNGNKQARTLLAELDGMWKEGEEFLAKLEELRKAFQQHVREEKKELLPAVKTALSAEEAQAITEKVEANKAALQEAKREEAEERRATARQAREKAERRRVQAEARKQRAREEEKRQQAELRAEKRRVREEEQRLQAETEAEQRRARDAGEAMARTGEGLVRGGQALAASAAAGAQASAATVRNSQQIGGVVAEALRNTDALLARAAECYSRPGSTRDGGLQAVTPVISGVAAETGKTWFELWKRTAESRGRRSLDFMHCFTPRQAAEVQTRYVGETMQAWLEANNRMLQISIKAYQSTVHRMERATEGTREARKGA